MPLVELLTLAAPALLVTAVAVCLAVRARRDTVLDLRDVPTVVLATRDGDRAEALVPAPLRGALVEPGCSGSLGARLRSTVPAEPAAAVATPDRAANGRVVLVRRRSRPLVALGRSSPY